MRQRAPLGRAIAQRVIYPFFLGASLLGVWVALRRGVAPSVAVAGVSTLCVAVTAALERWLPFERSWSRSHGDRLADWSHALVSNLCVVELLRATAIALLLGGGIAARDAIGASLWPANAPLAVQVALGLVVGELGFYWFHRWMHQGAGWRFHSVHHSSTRLYWLNSLRTHPVNTAGSFLSFQAPLAALGAGTDTMALVAIFHAAHGMLQHANVDLRLGPFNWLVSGPELHRWHHARTLDEASSNYGSKLVVWDLAFGTRFLPPDRPGNRDVGIDGLPGFPTSWWAQVVLPFRWRWVDARAHEDAGPSEREITA